MCKPIAACILGLAAVIPCVAISGCAIKALPKANPVTAENVLEHWRMQEKMLVDYQLTPPLPQTWPPNGSGMVEYYLYKKLPLLTGNVDDDIYAPEVKITLNVLEASLQPTYQRMPGNHRLQTLPGRRYEDDTFPERLTIAKQRLYQMVANPSLPTAKDRQLLRVYLDYIHIEAEIGDYLRVNHQHYFKWLMLEDKE